MVVRKAAHLVPRLGRQTAGRMAVQMVARWEQKMAAQLVIRSVDWRARQMAARKVDHSEPRWVLLKAAPTAAQMVVNSAAQWD